MRSAKLKLVALVLIAIGVAFSACTGGNSEVSDGEAHTDVHEAAAPQLLAITTVDYSFQAPDTVPAGLTTVRLTNKGNELHHVWIVRLQEGKTMADLMTWMQTSHTLPAWATDVGGPNAPNGPGASSEAMLRLEPGSYVLICVIPSPDGTPHVMKGMVRPLTVTGAGHVDAQFPPADIVMTLDDYKFDTNVEIAAGRRTIRIENAAAQSHEVVIVRLAPGKSVHDFLGWVEKANGPPPAELIGGITGIARGEFNQITADFTPGEYALICFFPDAKDGKPHFMHGMMRQFSVS